MQQDSTALPLFSFAAGERAKREGIARAESRDLSLAERLRDQARRIAREQGSVTIDDVRDYADANGIAVPSPSFWGSVIRATHGFVVIDYEKSRRAAKHSHLQPRWGLAS